MAFCAMYAAAAAFGRMMSRAATTAAVAVLVVSLSLPLLVPFGSPPPARGAAAQELGWRFRFTHARTQHRRAVAPCLRPFFLFVIELLRDTFSQRRRGTSATVARTGTGRRGGARCCGSGRRARWGVCSRRSRSPTRWRRWQTAARWRLGRSYRPAAASLVNRGHDIMVRFNSNPGGVVVDGVAYRLRQMHWHTPSEHVVNGGRYALELHMLHQSEAGAGGSCKYAVVAQLFKVSRRRRDGTIRRLERYVRRIARREDHEVLVDEVVDPRRPVSRSTVYYRYTGSFTTPPCTEGVTWLVAHQVRRVTRRQIRLLRNAVNDGSRRNARPLQEANGRSVAFYYTSPAHG